MQRDLQRLSEDLFDLLIVGGGINGLATARDAAQRGLSVALIEKKDFGGETSAASLKIIHGGLRYLQHFDFARMRESIGERAAMMRMAPHLIRPLPFLVPTYGHGMKGREAMTVALKINDFMSRHRNEHLSDPANHLPKGRVISAAACREIAPMVPKKGLSGCAVFYDGQMRSADRVNLSFALSAMADGAVLANYVEATQFIREGNKLLGVEARDVESGATLTIRAKVVADMTGPWNELVLNGKKDTVKSAGFQIVTRPLLAQDYGLAVVSEHVDLDAKVQRGGRHYFSTPWRGHTLWGTTDSVYKGDPDDWRISEGQIEAFVKELNEALPDFGFSRSEVTYAFGGLRPLEMENLNSGSQVSRKAELSDHPEIENLISVEGVKFTTCRLLAERTVNRAYEKLGSSAPACRSAETPLVGGDFLNMKQLRREAKSKAADLSSDELAELVEMYGTTYPALLQEGRSFRESQVRHAVKEEMALHLDDVVLRRTGLGTLGIPDDATIQACADWMADELGWSDEDKSREIDQLRDHYRYNP